MEADADVLDGWIWSMRGRRLLRMWNERGRAGQGSKSTESVRRRERSIRREKNPPVGRMPPRILRHCAGESGTTSLCHTQIDIQKCGPVAGLHLCQCRRFLVYRLALTLSSYQKSTLCWAPARVTRMSTFEFCFDCWTVFLSVG